MASDPKAGPIVGSPAPKRESGVRIFTYPKIIFIFPTLIMSLICWAGTITITDTAKYNWDRYQSKHAQPVKKETAATPEGGTQVQVADPSVPGSVAIDSAFKRRENVLGLTFLIVFFVNLMILAIDFPRFAIFGIVLGATTLLFFFLWVGFNFVEPLVRSLERVYIVANAEFYLLFSVVILAIYGVIWVTRWLDYWEILPNEILHHHGPLSDLERYPTMNLKFDKEIPDIFEHFMFGAGRLVLHVSSENKAIVMDNVLWVTKKEESLKKLMSRLEVRVTTDQEVASP